MMIVRLSGHPLVQDSLSHLQGGDIQATSLRSAETMQVQIILVHIYMATTITFVINIIMKGKSPPSIICTTTTNDIYHELKCDNATINMKMLEMHLPTSPIKHYLTPSPSSKSTKEDRETTTTKTVLRLQEHRGHIRQVLSGHLRLWTYDIFRGLLMEKSGSFVSLALLTVNLMLRYVLCDLALV